MSRARHPDESYEDYRQNLRKEQHLAKRRPKKYRHVSKVFAEVPDKDSDGNIKKDELGKPLMKQISQVFGAYKRPRPENQ